MSRVPPWLRAAAAGALVGLSLPPWGWWPLALVGIGWFHHVSSALATRRRAGVGFCFAAGWLLVGMAWMWFLSAPGYLAASLLFAGFHGLAAAAVPLGRWSVVTRPAAHTVAEAIRFSFPFGGVPLASLAISAAGGPLIWIARTGGAVLLTWAVLQLGCALGEAVAWLAARRRAGDGDWRIALGAATAVIAVWLVSLAAPDGRGPGQGALRLAVVQGGGPQGTRAIHTDAHLVLERHLAGTRTIVAGTVDAVLWPENVIDVATFAGSPELAEVVTEARRLNVPMIVSITEDTDDDRFLNAQVVVTPAGEVVSRYDKVRRVPFGEFMPLRSVLRAVGAPTDLVPRDARAGTGPAVLTLPDGTRLGVAISWEIFFGDRADDGVDHGGEVILNPTNGSSYTWTILQTQQVASSRLRAVEQGRWVVQAAPTGFSAFIDPAGDVFQRTSVSEARVITRTVERYAGRTWYSRLGDLPVAGAAAALTLLAAAWPRLRRLRAARPAP